MKIKGIKNIKDLKNKKVLLRLDLNLPIKDGIIINDFRLQKVLPTIKFLINKKAQIIILSHLGRKGESLKPVVKYLNKFIEAKLITDYEEIKNLQNNQVVVLENLRQNEGELNNDEDFTKKLATLGDIYINEAFSASHRVHASIVGLPRFLPSYIGFLFEEEIKHLSLVLKPPKPFLFILGGVKFKIKIPLIEKYLKTADHIFVGGALANNFFKAKKLEIGTSVVDDSIISTNILDSKKIILPTDVVTKNQEKILIKKINTIAKGDKILDAGPESITNLAESIKQSKLVLWNGPLGDYEHGFEKGTEDLLKIVADSNTTSIIGGGDTISLISKLKIEDKFTFISTGGGAMLTFLTEGTLPGIEAIGLSQK